MKSKMRMRKSKIMSVVVAGESEGIRRSIQVCLGRKTMWPCMENFVKEKEFRLRQRGRQGREFDKEKDRRVVDIN